MIRTNHFGCRNGCCCFFIFIQSNSQSIFEPWIGVRSNWRSSNTRSYKFNLLLWHDLISLSSISLSSTLSFNTKINHLFVLYSNPRKSYASLHSLLIIMSHSSQISHSQCVFLIQIHMQAFTHNHTRAHTFNKETKEYKSWKEMEEYKQTNKQISQFSVY